MISGAIQVVNSVNLLNAKDLLSKSILWFLYDGILASNELSQLDLKSEI